MHMTPERDGGECGRFRDDLLLLACGDVDLSDCSADLLEHVASCSACRAALRETRETVAILDDALKPEPLSAEVQSIILGPIVRPTRVVRPTRLAPLHAVGFAAAAGLILALMFPFNDSGRGDAEMLLNADDERELVAAYATLQWNTPIDFAIERVSETIDDVYGAIEGDSKAAGVLPWGPDDEWDTPAVKEGPSSRGRPISGDIYVSFCKLEPSGSMSNKRRSRNETY